MKASSVQGYVLALAFFNMYEADDNKLDEIHIKIRSELNTISRNLFIRKHNVRKQLDNAWKIFTELDDGKENVVSALPFIFHLVIKNPTISKHKKLRDLCLEANKMFMFKKDSEIITAKQLVNKFYAYKLK